MKDSQKATSDSTIRKKIAEVAADRKKQEAEIEQNRRRIMREQLYNIIGNKKIVITHNSK